MLPKSGSDLRPVRRKSQKRNDPLADSQPRRVLDTLIRRGLLATHGAINRYRMWASRLMQGSTTDLRTPFFSTHVKGATHLRSRSEIVTRFDGLVAGTWGKLGSLGVVLREVEKSERGNIGPQSMCLPCTVDGSDKISAIYADKPILSALNIKAFDAAVEQFQALIPEQSLALISRDQAIHGTGDGEDGMLTNTNSGFPFLIHPWWYTPGMKYKALEVKEATDWILERVKQLEPILYQAEDLSELPDCYAMVGQRLVQKGPKPYAPKSRRYILAPGKEEAIYGKRITVPYIEAMRAVKSPAGVNLILAAYHDQSVIDTEMQRILLHAKSANRAVLSGDISNFDATVPPWLLDRVSYAISTWFRGTEQRYVYNACRRMIYRMGAVLPFEIFPPKASSMKSGSFSTNMLGTCCNMVMLMYGHHSGLYELESFSVLGDDFVCDGPGIEPQKISASYAAFGMQANPDKQFVVPDYLHFLKRLHAVNRPGGMASAYRVLGSLLSLERLKEKPQDWNQYAYIVQAISKLSNLNFNPLFVTEVRYVQDGDRLRLGEKMTAHEVLTGAGQAGERLLREEASFSWRRNGNKPASVGFEDSLVNGVIRGEQPPTDPEALYHRVYGKEFAL